MRILDAADTKSWEGGSSFALSSRIYRLLWACVWMLLASWTPPQAHGWRRLLLRLFGARLADSAAIYPSAKIWSPANLQMEAFACIGPRATVYSMAPIFLGRYAIVSQGGHLCAGTHDIEDANFQLKARPIRIEARAWVAAEAFVGPGVTVGEGAVLGARGCAMRDIEPWTVCAGNPAVKIRDRRIRFPESGRGS
jgi:putative colanic acid biosynthesis acetyltransferase WcaF